MTKKQRLEKILSLIEEEEFSTQEELTDKLNELGYNVSQATVSRDINELNLKKDAGKSRKVKYVKQLKVQPQVSDKIIDLYKNIALSVTSANNLVIIRTLIGNGNSAGVAIDAMHFPQILGTVAGDDTLLIVTKTEKDAESLVKTLREI
ncbi:MAG: arginine repressor [Clostridia bacterium]|nr:arginine repressor [Clostridia bacterium]